MDKKELFDKIMEGGEVLIADLSHSPKLQELLKDYNDDIFFDQEGTLLCGEEEVIELFGDCYENEDEM